MLNHFRVHEKNIKFTIDEGPIYKIDSLPNNLFALSDDLLVHIRYYLGHIRVQICRYFVDDEGFLHSTHDRILLSSFGWTALYKKVASFKKKDVILNIEPDIFIKYEKSNNRGSYIFQHSYYANFVRLREDEFIKLKDLASTINLQFLQILIQQKLIYFNMTKYDIYHIHNLKSSVFFPEEPPDFTHINELIQHESQEYISTIDYPELQHLFRTHFKSAIIEKMHEQFDRNLCFNEFLHSINIVILAFDFQVNSISGVDWFNFYEKFNFCELLIEFQEEYNSIFCK